MEEILVVKADEKNINIKINGDNIDLLKAMADVIRQIAKQNGITIETQLNIIGKMLREE